MSLSWSLDYGVGTYCAVSLMFFLLLIKTKDIKKIAINCIIYLVISLFSFYIAVQILTLGNFTNFIKYTSDMSNSQFWYFGIDKIYYINQINLGIRSNIIIVISAIVALYNIYKILSDKYDIKNIVISIVLIAEIAAIYGYKIKSSGDLTYMLEFYLILILFMYAWGYLINNLKYSTKKINILVVSLSLISISIMGSIYLKANKTTNIANESRVYVEGLDGYYSKDFADHFKNLESVVGDGTYFSTYASAFEAINGDFNPTGIDYIIHAPGENSNKLYLNTFKEFNPQYVLTINKNFNQWENWIEPTNWSFYRILYKYYTPKYESLYNIIWTKDTSVTEFSVSTLGYNIENNGNRYRINVSGGETLNGIVDLNVNYSVEKLDSEHIRIPGNTWVNVQSDKMNIGLPINKNEHFLPVYLTNGIGYIDITVNPNDTYKLNINDVSIVDFYEKSTSNAVSVDANTNEKFKSKELSDSNWTNGVYNADNKIILLDRTKTKLEDFKVGDKVIDNQNNEYVITEIILQGKEWIHLIFDKEVDPNIANTLTFKIID